MAGRVGEVLWEQFATVDPKVKVRKWTETSCTGLVNSFFTVKTKTKSTRF